MINGFSTQKGCEDTHAKTHGVIRRYHADVRTTYAGGIQDPVSRKDLSFVNQAVQKAKLSGRLIFHH